MQEIWELKKLKNGKFDPKKEFSLRGPLENILKIAKEKGLIEGK